MELTGIIYMARNRTNDKVYVGQTTQSLSLRKRSHRWNATSKAGKFYTAVRSHGFDAFGWSILERCPIGSLDEREAFWIDRLDSCDRGYNLMRNGDAHHFVHSEETKRKIGLKSVGRRLPRETVLRIAAGNTGKKRSEETKQKIRDAATGRRWSPEMKERFRIINLGNDHRNKKAS